MAEDDGYDWDISRYNKPILPSSKKFGTRENGKDLPRRREEAYEGDRGEAGIRSTNGLKQI